MKSIFDVKSARLDALAILLKNDNPMLLKEALEQRSAQLKEFISLPFLLDVSEIEQLGALNLKAILATFQQFGLRIVGLRDVDPNTAQLAQQFYLAFTAPNDGQPAKVRVESEEVRKAKVAESFSLSAPHQTDEYNPNTQPTLVIKQPIRTGQQVYAKNADLIVLAMVNVGAEIIADGNIHVYAPLRGRALAGANGDKKARIFVQSMEAELVSVAGTYRTFEQTLPSDLNQKPVQVYLEDDRLVVSALSV